MVRQTDSQRLTFWLGGNEFVEFASILPPIPLGLLPLANGLPPLATRLLPLAAGLLHFGAIFGDPAVRHVVRERFAVLGQSGYLVRSHDCACRASWSWSEVADSVEMKIFKNRKLGETRMIEAEYRPIVVRTGDCTGVGNL